MSRPTPEAWMRAQRRQRAAEYRKEFRKQVRIAAWLALAAAVCTVSYFFVPTVAAPARAETSPQVHIPPVSSNFIEVEATITAYTSSEDETDENPFENAAGTMPGRGSIACPSKYPFGTVVEVEGKRYECDDRMNARYRQTERFDLWVESKQEAREWGVRELTINVII